MLWKFGTLKLFGMGSALLGAIIMSYFRPPKTKKEQIMQAACALGASLLFGGSAVLMFDSWFDWIDLATAHISDSIQFIATVHGLIGALAWGLFGGLAIIRDKFGSDPIQTVKDIKDL